MKTRSAKQKPYWSSSSLHSSESAEDQRAQGRKHHGFELLKLNVLVKNGQHINLDDMSGGPSCIQRIDSI